MVAVRENAVVLAATVTVIVPLFDPATGETVNHGELLRASQFVLDSIVNVMDSPEGEKLIEVRDKVKYSAVPSCVTLMVCVRSPALTVMVAFRSIAEGLAVALTVTVPLLEPEDGKTVSQDVSLLLTVQLVLDSIANVFSSDDDKKVNEVVDADRETPTCVTLIVCTISPPVTVMVAVRSDAVVLSVAVTLTVAFFEPDNGVIESQVSSLLIIQLVLDLISNVFTSPENENSSVLVTISSESGFWHPVIHIIPTDKANPAIICHTLFIIFFCFCPVSERLTLIFNCFTQLITLFFFP